MSGVVPSVSYQTATQAAGLLVKSGPTTLACIVVTASSSGSVTIYDNTAASGTVLFTKSSLAVGDVIHFGGVGIRAKNGLYVSVGGTGTVNVGYV